MSENSFENSTYSENNSYDEASSNPPESLNSPSNNVDDDFGSNGGVYGSRLTADLLTSLPVLTTVASAASSSAAYRSSHIKDAELSDLLVRKQPKFVPQAPKCAKCTKNVYKAEEIRAANKTYHKLCFKCNACNKLLEPNILTEHAGDLYCKNCYAKNFGPKGYGVGLAMPTAANLNGIADSSPSLPVNINDSAAVSNGSGLKWTFSSVQQHQQQQQPLNSLPHTKNGTHINSAYNHENKRLSVSSISGPVIVGGESNKCARCTKSVYAAEKVSAAGKTYHKLCFNCSTCKKLLSSMNCCDNSEGDIFCKACYGKQFGPKGVGYGISAGVMNTST